MDIALHIKISAKVRTHCIEEILRDIEIPKELEVYEQKVTKEQIILLIPFFQNDRMIRLFGHNEKETFVIESIEDLETHVFIPFLTKRKVRWYTEKQEYTSSYPIKNTSVNDQLKILNQYIKEDQDLRKRYTLSLVIIGSGRWKESAYLFYTYEELNQQVHSICEHYKGADVYFVGYDQEGHSLPAISIGEVVNIQLAQNRVIVRVKEIYINKIEKGQFYFPEKGQIQIVPKGAFDEKAAYPKETQEKPYTLLKNMLTGNWPLEGLLATEIREENFQTPFLNDEQKKAVVGALATPDVYLLEGTHRTGKTTVVSEVCYQLVQQHQRVLVVAPSDSIVQQLLQKIQSMPSVYTLRAGNQLSEEVALKEYLNKVAIYATKRFDYLSNVIEWVEEERELTSLLLKLETSLQKWRELEIENQRIITEKKNLQQQKILLQNHTSQTLHPSLEKEQQEWENEIFKAQQKKERLKSSMSQAQTQDVSYELLYKPLTRELKDSHSNWFDKEGEIIVDSQTYKVLKKELTHLEQLPNSKSIYDWKLFIEGSELLKGNTSIQQYIQLAKNQSMRSEEKKVDRQDIQKMSEILQILMQWKRTYRLSAGKQSPVKKKAEDIERVFLQLQQQLPRWRPSVTWTNQVCQLIATVRQWIQDVHKDTSRKSSIVSLTDPYERLEEFTQRIKEEALYYKRFIHKEIMRETIQNRHQLHQQQIHIYDQLSYLHQQKRKLKRKSEQLYQSDLEHVEYRLYQIQDTYYKHEQLMRDWEDEQQIQWKLCVEKNVRVKEWVSEAIDTAQDYLKAFEKLQKVQRRYRYFIQRGMLIPIDEWDEEEAYLLKAQLQQEQKLLFDWVVQLEKGERIQDVSFLPYYKDKATVIGATVEEISDPNFEKNYGFFDYIIVEYASLFQAMSLLGVLSKNTRIMLVGKIDQLPQLPMNSTCEILGKETPSFLPFMHAALFQTLWEQVPSNRRMILTSRHQMHRGIAMCAQQFKKDVLSNFSLRTENEQHFFENRYIHSLNPLLWINIPFQEEYNVLRDARGVQNIQEALVIQQLIKDMEEVCQHKEEEHEVFIITLTQLQAQEIEKRLTPHPFLRVRVGTIDEFRGEVAEVVIVSLVYNCIKDHVYKGDMQEIEEILTRASHLLMIVGSQKQWVEKNRGKTRNAFQQMMKIVHEYDGHRTYSDIIKGVSIE